MIDAMYFLVALTIYLVIMSGIGLYGAMKERNISHFYVAGRRLGVISTSATTAATTIGGSATIVTVAMVYSYGITGIWLDLAGGLGLMALGLFLAKKVRETGVYSLPELVERFYGKKARIASSLLIILAEVAWIALLIQALRFVLSVTADIDPSTALILSAAISVLYTFLGGQYAVAYSDVIQLVLMVVGIVFIAAPLALIKAGGFSAFASLPEDYLSFPTSHGLPLKNVIPLFLLMFLPHMVGSDIYSKVLSAKDGKTASRGMIIAGGMKLVFGAMMVIMGLSALILFPHLNSGGEVLPVIVDQLLPGWAAVIVLIALTGVMMSSADSCLLTGATTFTNDLYRFIRKKAGDRELLIVAKLTVILLGGCAYLIAVRSAGIIETLKLGYTIFASSIILPVIAGFVDKKGWITERGALLGMLMGGAVSLLWLYEVKMWYPEMFKAIDPVLAGMVACALAMLTFSFKPASPSPEH